MREKLFFSHPIQKVQGIQVWACSAYGAMLWDMQSEATMKYLRCWNIQIRLAYKVSYATHCNIVENVLCKGHPSLKKQIYSRYPKFVKSLLQSTSREVRFLAAVVLNDQRSLLCRNISYLNDLCKINVLTVSKPQMKQSIPKLPPVEPWRESLLSKLLQIRFNKEYFVNNISKKQNDQWIESLCIS